MGNQQKFYLFNKIIERSVYKESEKLCSSPITTVDSITLSKTHFLVCNNSSTTILMACFKEKDQGISE